MKLRTELITTHRPYKEPHWTALASSQNNTLWGEYVRTIELMDEMIQTKGLYFAIALLADSSYSWEDITNLLTVIHNTPHLKAKYIKLNEVNHG